VDSHDITNIVKKIVVVRWGDFLCFSSYFYCMIL
jgi:hypothetical protein